MTPHHPTYIWEIFRAESPWISPSGHHAQHSPTKKNLPGIPCSALQWRPGFHRFTNHIGDMWLCMCINGCKWQWANHSLLSKESGLGFGIHCILICTNVYTCARIPHCLSGQTKVSARTTSKSFACLCPSAANTVYPLIDQHPDMRIIYTQICPHRRCRGVFVGTHDP